MKLHAKIEPDTIRIYDEHQNEIVGWHEDEWKEDPFVTMSIANAIKMAYEEPELLISTLEKVRGTFK